MNDRRTIAASARRDRAAAGAAGCATQARQPRTTPASAPRTITGTATGKVEGVPDTLTVTLGVESRRRLRAGRARAELRPGDAGDRGAEGRRRRAEDLQTAQLSLNPTFDQQGRIDRLLGVEHGHRQGRTTWSNGGKIVDAAAAQAGDDIRVQGVVLSIEDTGSSSPTARADAVRRARAPGPPARAGRGRRPRAGREDHRAAAGAAGVLRAGPDGGRRRARRRRRSSPGPRSSPST